MRKIHIPKTTLFGICWGKEYFFSTLKSFIASLKNVSFDKIIILTDGDYVYQELEPIINKFKIEIVSEKLDLEIGVDNQESRSKFSKILLNAMNNYCDQEFILTIQPDSCIISSEKWRNDFLKYDYIGAPWPIEIIKAIDMASNKIKEPKNFVGNGGFSLRSKKYIEASLNMPIMHKNEDLNLCVFNYDSMVAKGIKFAPLDIAYDFSVEHPIFGGKIYDRQFLLTYNSFGFHGKFNIAGMKYIHDNSKEIK